MTTEGVGWASEEASDLVVPPLNLMLYMHLRVFTYTCVLVLDCTLGPDEVSFADVGHPFVFQNTKGPGRVTHGWEDLYSVRPHPPETFFHDCLFWDPLCDSSFFSRREGASHFTGSCRVPYRQLSRSSVSANTSAV